MSLLDMYRVKKKRAVDPSAPPRPNLLNHEKRLKEATTTVEQQAQIIQNLQQRIEHIESKLTNQTAYLNSLHQYIHNKLKG
jgi:CII-binding regulator of phage lambda lysogenization HflD